MLAGYTQALRPGVKASFGLALDTQKLNEISPVGPSHKVSQHMIFHNSEVTDDPVPIQVGASFTFES
jgi:hypothetical protein